MSLDIIKVDQLTCLGKKPLLEINDGIWIAGGAIRQWFVGNEKSTDIDVFGKTQESLDTFVTNNLKGCRLLTYRENLRSYDYKGTMVQIITYDFYENVEALLDSFDFNVCQFAYDGKEVYSTVSAITSVLRNHLGVHKITPPLVADSLRRAFKYQEKGYKPCLGTIQKLGESFSGVSKEEIQNQISISPGGGMRFVGVD